MLPKYRAWDKKGKKMLQVSDLAWDYQTGQHLVDVICVNPDNPEADGLEYKAGEVELVEFTGLKDRQGAEIYEGDIVIGKPPHYIEKVKGVVKYGGLAFAFVGKTESGKEWFDTITTPTITEANHLEVVGNVYENPKLLEAGE